MFSLLVNWLAQQNFSCGVTTAQGYISERNITSGHIQFISAKVVDSLNPALSDFDCNWQSQSLVKCELRSGLSLRFQSFVYFCCLHIAINPLSSSRSCVTRLHFESVSRHHDNIKSSKDALCTATDLWVCCPPTLKARSNFECSFNLSCREDCFHSAV